MEDVRWLVGGLISLIGLFLGGFYRLSGRINAVNDGANSSMTTQAETRKAEDDRLHERINRVRDEYVRRDDLDKDIKALEKNIDALREDMRAHTNGTNERLDKLLSKLSGKQ